MRQYQVFSDDPTLLSYLVSRLRSKLCALIKEDGRYYLWSFYVEALMTTGSIGKDADGLLAVLNLLTPNFGNLTDDLKIGICIDGILSILNGTIKLKYRDYNGLKRMKSISAGITEMGSFSDVGDQAVAVTATKDVPSLFKSKAPYKHFLVCDKQPPTAVKIWNIARRHPEVARALYHFAIADQEDTVNLNKVREEIEKDVGYKTLEHWVGNSQILEEFKQWAHNAYVSGGKARHSMVRSDPNLAVGIIPTPQSPLDFHIPLIEWLKTK